MLNKEMKQEENPVLDIVTSSLEDGKAEDVVVIDLRGKTSIANENLKAAGYKSVSEGEAKGDWVLIDAYDVIVHLFRPEVREFYNLEKMWQSAANLRKE